MISSGVNLRMPLVLWVKPWATRTRRMVLA